VLSGVEGGRSWRAGRPRRDRPGRGAGGSILDPNARLGEHFRVDRSVRVGCVARTTTSMGRCPSPSPRLRERRCGEDFAEPDHADLGRREGGEKMQTLWFTMTRSPRRGAVFVRLSARPARRSVGPRRRFRTRSSATDKATDVEGRVGWVELLSLLLLGLAGWMRRASRWSDRLCRPPGAKAARPLQRERPSTQSSAAFSRRDPSARTAP